MIEFKFRAWDKDSSQMIYQEDTVGCNYNCIDFLFDFTETGIQLIAPIEGEFPEVRDAELMQFTGLKDKNGKDIYEGDILKHHGQVAWNDVEHRWSAIDLNWNDRREWHDINYLTSPFEVIGNIYENPELLK